MTTTNEHKEPGQPLGLTSSEGLGAAAPKRDALSAEAMRHRLTAHSLAEARRVADALLQKPVGKIDSDDLGYVARIIQRLCVELEAVQEWRQAMSAALSADTLAGPNVEFSGGPLDSR